MRYEKICKEMIEEWFDGYWKQIFWSFFSNPKVEYNLTVKSNLRPCLHNWAAIVHARLTAFLLLTHSYKLSKIGLIKIRPRLKLKCRLHPLLTPASLLGTRQKKRHSDCILKYSILEEWFSNGLMVLVHRSAIMAFSRIMTMQTSQKIFFVGSNSLKSHWRNLGAIEDEATIVTNIMRKTWAQLIGFAVRSSHRQLSFPKLLTLVLKSQLD